MNIADRIRLALSQVVDPELPMLTIDDLGILRDVHVVGESVEVLLTPTYSGCPATDLIREQVEATVRAAGYEDVRVRMALTPPWTTDWISETGKRKLAASGIAPPRLTGQHATPVLCPQCSSEAVTTVSEFGSTACKALMICDSCGEPFDRFKEH